MKILLLLLTLLSTLLANMGHVSALTGSAQLLRQNATMAVAKGDIINQNDLLKTATRSKVQVVLNDDTVITIGPESEYLFERYQDGTAPEVVMQLKRGFFKTVTGKIGKIAPQRFKIRTKAATIGIRGTQFMAYVNGDEEKIGCIQGEIIVWTKDAEYIVSAGKMLIYKEKRWRLYEMNMGDFAPVLVGLTLDKGQQENREFYLPSLENSYILEEQIIDQYQTGQEPFSFDLGVGATNQPPTYIP